MQVIITFDGRTEVGGTPLLMHHERLSDPLDTYCRQLAAVSSKRKKTDADHREMAHIEFQGGMYTNGNGPCIPTINILRTLQEAAKRHKRGADVLRGIVPLTEHADLSYEGPRDPEELWKEGFWLRKSVGISNRRVIRTRPHFHDWVVSAPFEVDPTIFDSDTLAQIVHEAGRYIGLCDRRPINGRFCGTMTEWEMSGKVDVDEASFALSNAVRAGIIQDEDEARAKKFGLPGDLTKAAVDAAKKFRDIAANQATNQKKTNGK